MTLDWLTDLESAKRKQDKRLVIEKALIASRLGSASAQCFLYNCWLAYNPNYNYNIKFVPMSANIGNRPNNFTKFWALCEALRTNTIIGHNATTSVYLESQCFDSDLWNRVCRAVLLKEYGVGLTPALLNSVLKNTEWKIPSKNAS